MKPFSLQQKVTMVVILTVLVVMLVVSVAISNDVRNTVDHIEGDTTEVPYEAP